MPHVFISYSSTDSEIANSLYQTLNLAGAEPFLAEISLGPGVAWKESILEALRDSEWIFFLATPHSCKSQAVAHEIGASLVLQKKFIPIMLGVKPQELPKWVDDKQAISFEDTSKVNALIEQIGNKLGTDRLMIGVILGALLFLSILVLNKKN